MKKWYVYIFNTRAKILHIGVTKDIIKALAWYDKLPVISIEPNYKLQKLIYLVDAPNKETAMNYFQQLSNMKKAEIIKIIKEFNPTLMELIPGTNIEL